MVAPYACGDVTMPRALFGILYSDVVEAGMLHAHEREMKMIALTRAMTRRGLKIDCARLERDVQECEGRFLRKPREHLRLHDGSVLLEYACSPAICWRRVGKPVDAARFIDATSLY